MATVGSAVPLLPQETHRTKCGVKVPVGPARADGLGAAWGDPSWDNLHRSGARPGPEPPTSQARRPSPPSALPEAGPRATIAAGRNRLFGLTAVQMNLVGRFAQPGSIALRPIELSR
jgi:hypothetical protein